MVIRLDRSSISSSSLAFKRRDDIFLLNARRTKTNQVYLQHPNEKVVVVWKYQKHLLACPCCGQEIQTSPRHDQRVRILDLLTTQSMREAAARRFMELCVQRTYLFCTIFSHLRISCRNIVGRARRTLKR